MPVRGVTPLEVARLVAARWPHYCDGGEWCPQATYLLVGALQAHGYARARALDLSDRVGARDPRDFHYVAELDGVTYDLTHRQFDARAEVPTLAGMDAIRAEWRDVRVVGEERIVGWVAEQIETGRTAFAKSRAADTQRGAKR